MSQARVFDGAGKETGTVELSDEIFNAPVHEAALHQALLRQLANARQGTHQTKTRGEVSGGGKKPWKQKGTGRARQGSTRAPQWRHGGTVFGPHPRGYEQKMPRKQRRLALRAALALKSQGEQLRVLEGLALDAPHTGQMADLFVELGSEAKTLFVLPAHDLVVEKSTRNLPWVRTILAQNLNVFDVLEADMVVLTREALAQVEAQLA
jgi:large subunit ribosomal protein L4